MSRQLVRPGAARRTFHRRYTMASGVELAESERSNPVELDLKRGYRDYFCVECGHKIPRGIPHLADRNSTARLHVGCGQNVEVDGLPRQKRPCVNCPFRRDVEPGEFPTGRYEALRETCRNEDTVQAPFDAPMFACHKSPHGSEFACAGWLAVEGLNHLRVRLALATGELPPESVQPAADWPDLYRDYDEMAAAMGG